MTDTNASDEHSDAQADDAARTTGDDARMPAAGSEGGRAGEAVDGPPPKYGDREWSRPWMGAFLEALSVMPVVAQACRAARVSKTTAYDYRMKDEAFAESWAEAFDLAVDLLHQNTHRWGTVGLEVTETRQEFDANGRMVKEVRTQRTDRNPQIAMMLLKGHRPEFRESSKVEHTGPGGGPVQLEVNRMPTRERMLALIEFSRELERADEVDGEAYDADEETL